MHAAHVLVLPSVFEGFGLVIPEAMSTGMPVIASTHTAGPEIIREGLDGFVLEPDDVEGLADRIERLRSDRPRAVAIGIEAAHRARDFSWEAHSGRLQQILGLLIHGESDHLADVGLVGEQHHDAVDTWRRATVRRCAQTEC